MEFEPTIGKQFLDEYLLNKEDIIFTFVFPELFEMAHNWYLHLKKINLENKCFLICLEEESYKKCKDLNFPCILYKTNINFLNSPYFEYMYEMFKIIHYIYKNYKINILYTNTDVIFFKNPFEKLKSEMINDDFGLITNKFCKALSFINNNNFYLENDWYKQTVLFFYLKYNEKIINILLDFFRNFYYDTIDPNTIIKTKYLKSYDFTNIYYIMQDEFLKQKILDICYTLSYEIEWDADYMIGYGEMVDENNKKINSFDFKKVLMKKNNHWLL
jgi:hypothetical protein